MSQTTTDVQDALRTWAKGNYPQEAGVELLIRASDSRFARAGYPWVCEGEDPGWWWVDVEQMTEENYGGLSGGEMRLLRIAASLLGGASVSLYENIAGLDRDQVQLVLAAIAHSSGSHEHSGGLVPDPEGLYVGPDGVRRGFEKLGSLYSWPTTRES